MSDDGKTCTLGDTPTPTPDPDCEVGQYFDGAECKSCTYIANCNQISCSTIDDQTCDTCIFGFHAVGKTCEVTCESVANCKVDSVTCDEDGANSKCSECESTFALINNVCEPIPDCDAGNFLNAQTNKCVACTGSDDNCSSWTCTSAEDAKCASCTDNDLFKLLSDAKAGGVKFGVKPARLAVVVILMILLIKMTKMMILHSLTFLSPILLQTSRIAPLLSTTNTAKPVVRNVSQSSTDLILKFIVTKPKRRKIRTMRVPVVGTVTRRRCRIVIGILELDVMFVTVA